MKYILLAALLCFAAQTIHAQSTKPDFNAQLAAAKTDSGKVAIYRKLFDHYYTMPGDSAKTYLQQGLAAFQKDGYRHGEASMLLLLSNIDNQHGQLAAARAKGEEALKIFTDLKEEGWEAKAHINVGNAESYMGDYSTAVKHFLAAEKIFEEENDTLNLVNTYLELGAANDYNNNHDQALGYYQKALPLSLLKPDGSTILLYNNIGLYHARKTEYDEALKYFEQAETFGKSHPAYLKSNTAPLINIGKVYHAKGDDKKALDYMNQALAISKELDMKESESREMLEIGRIETTVNPANTASLLEGLKTAKEVGSKRLQRDFLEVLGDAADSRHDYKAETEYMKQAEVINDSVFNLDKAKEIANLQSEYELKQTSTQLEALKNAELRNARKKDIIIVTAIVLAVTLLTLVLFYVRSRRLNRKLKASEQDLKKVNAVKDRLFSIIGHDLKGPVGNIPTLLSIYRNEEGEHEREYILKAMEESSQASMETLEKLLSWGKQQIKGNLYKPGQLNVNEIMEHEMKLLGIAAAQKNITLQNHMPAGLKVWADEDQFKFVLRNLISNAIKFTHSGGLVEIGAAPVVGNGHVAFTVKDNGLGIDKEMQQHIFEPYNESTVGTANEAGTSIGLILCKEFVVQNGGDIWVKSEKGQGTTFSFTMNSN